MSAEEIEGIYTVLPETPEEQSFVLRTDMSANDAIKVDSLIERMLQDMGSVYRRAYTRSALGFPPELRELRRFLRDTQDIVRDTHPEAFFK